MTADDVVAAFNQIDSLVRAQHEELTSQLAEVESAPNTTAADPISPDIRAALGDIDVPDGVDPSFLAALPNDIRHEVIQEHLRMQRMGERNLQTPSQQNQAANESLVEVNPEFLAALPPNIQSEVLMQQRIEQQRQTAQNSNPEDPVDTAAFFQNLPESLRRAVSLKAEAKYSIS